VVDDFRYLTEEPFSFSRLEAFLDKG
jgi:hypothetical protein